MSKLANLDPHTRGQIVRKLIAKLPPYLVGPVRRYRASPSLANWKSLRYLAVGPTEVENVWRAVEKTCDKRFGWGAIPTKLEIDIWLYTYFN